MFDKYRHSGFAHKEIWRTRHFCSFYHWWGKVILHIKPVFDWCFNTCEWPFFEWVEKRPTIRKSQLSYITNNQGLCNKLLPRICICFATKKVQTPPSTKMNAEIKRKRWQNDTLHLPTLHTCSESCLWICSRLACCCYNTLYYRYQYLKRSTIYY